MQYEVINRLNAYNTTIAERGAATTLIEGLTLIELSPIVLQRALRPWPIPIRTLDALHLATAIYSTSHNVEVALATYDLRMSLVVTNLGLAAVFPA